MLSSSCGRFLGKRLDIQCTLAHVHRAVVATVPWATRDVTIMRIGTGSLWTSDALLLLSTPQSPTF